MVPFLAATTVIKVIKVSMLRLQIIITGILPHWLLSLLVVTLIIEQHQQCESFTITTTITTTTIGRRSTTTRLQPPSTRIITTLQPLLSSSSSLWIIPQRTKQNKQRHRQGAFWYSCRLLSTTRATTDSNDAPLPNTDYSYDDDNNTNNTTGGTTTRTSAFENYNNNNNNNEIVQEYDNEEYNDADTSVAAVLLRAVTFYNLPKNQEPDVLCDYLLEIGACSASVIDADRGTNNEVPLFDEPGQYPFAGSTQQQQLQQQQNIWNRSNVTAHFPASTNLDYVIELLQETDFFQGNDEQVIISYEVESLPNQDWVLHVQQGWQPIIVADRFVLRFPWHDDTIVTSIIEKHKASLSSSSSSSLSLSSNLVQLKLEGGIAFGTGEHATTQLCLQWLADTITNELSSSNQVAETTTLRVLDYGSGSGILGLGACAIGQQQQLSTGSYEPVTAVGIDIDIDSCYIANTNSKLNNISMKNYLPPLFDTADNESKSLLLKAIAKCSSNTTNTTIDTDDDNAESTAARSSNTMIIPDRDWYETKYDICVANILAVPLVTLAPTIANLVQPNGGYLGLSGILSHQASMIIEAYTAAGFRNVQVTNQIGDWVLITGIRD